MREIEKKRRKLIDKLEFKKQKQQSYIIY